LVVPKGCPYDAASIALHGASWPCYLKSEYLKTVRDAPHVAVAAPVFMSALYTPEDGAQVVYCGVNNDITQLKRTWTINGAFPASSGQVLVGSEMAKNHHWQIGQKVTLPGLKGQEGTVSGVLKPTQGADDLFIYLPLDDAQRIFKRPSQIT